MRYCGALLYYKFAGARQCGSSIFHPEGFELREMMILGIMTGQETTGSKMELLKSILDREVVFASMSSRALRRYDIINSTLLVFRYSSQVTSLQLCVSAS